jgi:hypothetical protein
MVIKHRVLRKLFGPWRLEVTGYRRKCIAKNVLITKYYSDNKIGGNKMGGTCGTYGREEKCPQPFDGDLKEGRYFLDLAVDGR